MYHFTKLRISIFATILVTAVLQAYLSIELRNCLGIIVPDVRIFDFVWCELNGAIR